MSSVSCSVRLPRLAADDCSNRWCALGAPTIRDLAAEGGPLQFSLFDQRNRAPTRRCRHQATEQAPRFARPRRPLRYLAMPAGAGAHVVHRSRQARRPPRLCNSPVAAVRVSPAAWAKVANKRTADAPPVTVLSRPTSVQQRLSVPRAETRRKGMTRQKQSRPGTLGGSSALVGGQLDSRLRLRKLISQDRPTRHRSAAKEFQITAGARALDNRVRFGWLFAVRGRPSDS
jgi:hypothetical protein